MNPFILLIFGSLLDESNSNGTDREFMSEEKEPTNNEQKKQERSHTSGAKVYEFHGDREDPTLFEASPYWYFPVLVAGLFILGFSTFKLLIFRDIFWIPGIAFGILALIYGSRSNYIHLKEHAILFRKNPFSTNEILWEDIESVTEAEKFVKLKLKNGAEVFLSMKLVQSKLHKEFLEMLREMVREKLGKG